MSAAKSKAASQAASDTAAIAIEDEKYYDVLVSEGFEYKRVKFGVVSKTHVLGEFLKDLLASEHAPKVSTYSEKI